MDFYSSATRTAVKLVLTTHLLDRKYKNLTENALEVYKLKELINKK